MAQVEIKDFKYGLNRRRPRIAGVPGNLWNLINGHISRGGDIESAKKFVSTYTLPASTFGLGQINGQLFVFGSADLAASMPVGVQYQRLASATAAAMTRVLHNNTYGGKHYVIAEYVDGAIEHFYNGTRIAAWDTLATDNSSFTTLADYLGRKINVSTDVDAIAFGSTVLVTATVPGTAFTISATTTDGGDTTSPVATVATVQANVAAVAEVRATGSFTVTGGTRSPGVNKVTQITVNAVSLLVKHIDWVIDNSSTATAVATEINNNSATHGYSASAAGAIITITAAVGTGATPNGYVVAHTTAGNVTATNANLSGGVTKVTAVAQVSTVALSGTYDSVDTYTVVVNGTSYIAIGRASGHGTYAFVYKTREYVTAGSLLEYSAVNSGSDFSTAGAASGTGFINISNDSDGSEPLQALAPYQTFVAAFTRKTIRIYALQTDATLNAFQQTLDNSGTIAPRSVLSYGNADVFYLDETGIRSIQARDITNVAFVNDAGSAIDPLVSDWITSLDEDTVARAVSVIEPVEGRFMLAIGTRIYVLSYFPSTKVNAWSYYEPGFTATDFIRTKRKLYARDTGTIYLYGGASGTTYPAAGEQTITVDMPFITAQDPATFKRWEGFDMACQGQWQVDLLVDPDDETKLISIGKVTKSTFNLPGIATVGEEPMVAPRLTSNAGGKLTVSSMVLHFLKTETG